VGKTCDWVILYYDDGSGEQQCTVITSQQGPLKGKRIVRGREADCAPYYQKQQGQPPASVTECSVVSIMACLVEKRGDPRTFAGGVVACTAARACIWRMSPKIGHLFLWSWTKGSPQAPPLRL
jgi:hypothetical protein